MRVLLIGNTSGRLDCLAEAIANSHHSQLFILTNYTNPGLSQKGLVTCGPTADPDFVAHWADLLRHGPTMAIISNEEPLAAGVVDKLVEMGIPTVGPTQALARIETSKIYARDLMDRYNIRVNPLWGRFDEHCTLKDATDYMHALGEFVIKPDGLTGGKGVKVMGDHFQSLEQAIVVCMGLRDQRQPFIIEEKLPGEEFSLMSFVGGEVIHTFPIQDHKRLINGDFGPNTGGMGSYSRSSRPGESLPFVTQEMYDQACAFNEAAIQALEKDNRQSYYGVLYGNYIVTPKGLRLIEFNARAADPEIMNLLPLLETDFVDAAWAMARGELKPGMIRFANKASVVKYLVPMSYPDGNCPPDKIDLSSVTRDPNLRIYYGGLNIDVLTGGRTIAMVGIADTLEKSERVAETACNQLPTLVHRSDIGTAHLIGERMRKFNDIMGKYAHEDGRDPSESTDPS